MKHWILPMVLLLFSVEALAQRPPNGLALRCSEQPWHEITLDLEGELKTEQGRPAENPIELTLNREDRTSNRMEILSDVSWLATNEALWDQDRHAIVARGGQLRIDLQQNILLKAQMLSANKVRLHRYSCAPEGLSAIGGLYDCSEGGETYEVRISFSTSYATGRPEIFVQFPGGQIRVPHGREAGGEARFVSGNVEFVVRGSRALFTLLGNDTRICRKAN